MSTRRPSATRRTPTRRRNDKPPLRPTQWGHSVAAIVLTLLALGSWTYVIRQPAEGPRITPNEVQEIISEQAATEQSEPRTFSIAASGDILIHGPVASRAAAVAGAGYDFTPMFARVGPLIEEADLAICHMETPVSRDNTDVSSYPIFNAPREIADALAGAGYDLCSTASNHSYDKGPTGVRNTIAVLQRAGLRTEGTATNRREARRAEVINVKGVEVAHLSYTYGLNGLTLPDDRGYLVNVIDRKRILREARRARAAGAEFVVVSLHWGLEFQTEPTDEQLRGARRLLKSKNIDLLIGHHAHVPQAITRVGREFAILGLGNFLSNQLPGATPTCCIPEAQDGLLVRIDVAETESGWTTKVSYWPTWVRPGTYEILPVATALADPSLASLHEDLQASWRRTTATVDSLGARRAGVRPAATP